MITQPVRPTFENYNYYFKFWYRMFDWQSYLQNWNMVDQQQCIHIFYRRCCPGFGRRGNGDVGGGRGETAWLAPLWELIEIECIDNWIGNALNFYVNFSSQRELVCVRVVVSHTCVYAKCCNVNCNKRLVMCCSYKDRGVTHKGKWTNGKGARFDCGGRLRVELLAEFHLINALCHRQISLRAF